jgi:hypothetical protein
MTIAILIGAAAGAAWAYLVAPRYTRDSGQALLHVVGVGLTVGGVAALSRVGSAIVQVPFKAPLTKNRLLQFRV